MHIKLDPVDRQRVAEVAFIFERAGKDRFLTVDDRTNLDALIGVLLRRHSGDDAMLKDVVSKLFDEAGRRDRAGIEVMVTKLVTGAGRSHNVTRAVA